VRLADLDTANSARGDTSGFRLSAPDVPRRRVVERRIWDADRSPSGARKPVGLPDASRVRRHDIDADEA
jgi:hypothetical protein